VIFTDAIKRVPLSTEIIGRVCNGSFEPKDGMPLYIPELWKPITGLPMNPAARARPEDFIETGFSPIDGLNTLVRGQKLPIFSAAGLPAPLPLGRIVPGDRVILETSAGDVDISGQGYDHFALDLKSEDL
jgi:V/A-type H+-transporting ATPase subunit B